MIFLFLLLLFSVFLFLLFFVCVACSFEMKAFTVVFVGLVAVALALGDPYQCSSTVSDSKGNKYKYDLSSLYHDPQLSDSLYYMGDTGDLTYFNICGDTTTVCSPASPVCRRSGLWSTMGFGDLETQKFLSSVDKGKGVTIEYTRGEWCPDTTGTSAKIHILCGKDEAVTDLKIENDGCSITATIKSQAGCGKLVSSGPDGGETFAIVVLVLLLVGVIAYIGISMFVNWKFKGAQTIPEMLPHKEFWMSLPLLIRDGVMFIVHGCKKGDYVSV